MSSSYSLEFMGMCLMYSLQMPSPYTKLLSLRIEPFIPEYTHRLLQQFHVILMNIIIDLKPMDLLALQCDWVDDCCPEEQEEKHEKSVEDDKKALNISPSSSESSSQVQSPVLSSSSSTSLDECSPLLSQHEFKSYTYEDSVAAKPHTELHDEPT